MHNIQSFGSWVRARRQTLGLTQEQFSKLVYCAPITVRKIEHDQLRPSRQLAISIVEKVGVPPEDQEALIHLARARRGPLFVPVLEHLAELFVPND
jgi:transcriptional regulator with XRE-family HTH domain